MNFPKDDGLSSREEFQLLGSIEDVLTESMLARLKAEFVGRITTDGRREFYFYAPGSEGLDLVVKKVNDQFSDYKFDFGSQADSKWKQYFEVLYPSDEDWQRMKDRELIAVLEKNGDDLTTQREVDHWIYFRSRELRSEFNRAVTKLGFKVRCESKYPRFFTLFTKRPYGSQIVRVDNVDAGSISEVTLQLFKLAKSFDAEYDGWETQVTSSSEPVKAIQ
jgi:regulator of RNase E activity RraB